ncbi:putative D-lactate dehydrogenase [Aspergillus steynii IBT 23096]|uniref:Putative D-lactate dehydrogenase n=1 Tax=Aspergillus steynii IBT 23096 TaxID=1392250 RepID=A0A2I2FV70_9EURO|nr:putative D-lactate dehydrogenase [Aspergillus steynii IBT 23096]PLB44535.1 putative D-lactate dehydrogenase [Aspergillus steynii IBT 23096]
MPSDPLRHTTVAQNTSSQSAPDLHQSSKLRKDLRKHLPNTYLIPKQSTMTDLKPNLAVFSAKSYDKQYLTSTLQTHHPSLVSSLTFHSFALSSETVSLAHGATAICVFVNDILDAPVLRTLHAHGTRAILLRCAGYNNIDLAVAEELGLFVANVPSYSPEAVAEFAVALIQTLNRKTHRAYNRVREGNFNLEGFLGHTLRGQTVGVVGVGRIGMALARIFNGFGCKMIAYDPFGGEEFKQYGEFVDLETLLSSSDIVSLHCPLTDATRHILGEENLGRMKRGALLVNTSRGGLIDTKAAIAALKKGQLGGLALDVYEEEKDLFYNDHSGEIIHDDTLMRVTLANLQDFVEKRTCRNSLVREGHLLVSRETEPVRL